MSLFILFLTFFSSPARADEGPPVVRVLNARLAESLEQSYAVSPTVRALMDELEESDLIVHVLSLSPELRRSYSGTLKFVQSAGGRRYLRIAVDERLPADQRASVIAHELQHAVEVARAAYVVDHATLSVLYKHIGYETGRDPDRRRYETDDARRIGALVLADLKAAELEARHASVTRPRY